MSDSKFAILRVICLSSGVSFACHPACDSFVIWHVARLSLTLIQHHVMNIFSVGYKYNLVCRFLHLSCQLLAISLLKRLRFACYSSTITGASVSRKTTINYRKTIKRAPLRIKSPIFHQKRHFSLLVSLTILPLLTKVSINPLIEYLSLYLWILTLYECYRILPMVLRTLPKNNMPNSQ